MIFCSRFKHCNSNIKGGEIMWGKILAGVVVGVGAVAAAPFTGGGSLLAGATAMSSLAGAGTIAAAAGAAAVGATAGAVMADTEEDKKKAIRNEGKAEGMAVVRQEIEALETKLSRALEQLKSNDGLFNAIIALEAVGVACAACDDDFSDAEKEEIGEFVQGMLAQNIPENVKIKIQDVYDNPPTVKEAFELAENSGLEMSMFEDLIQFVMEIDGIKPEEKVFVRAWSQLKAA